MSAWPTSDFARAVALSLLAWAGAATFGCSSKSKVTPIPVTGQVFLDDKPTANAIVTFHPVGAAADAAHPTGRADENGVFHLTTFVADDGAPAGEYQVTIASFSPVDQPGQPRKIVNALPEKYSKVELSNLTATVDRGSNNLEPFKLTSN